MTAASVVAGAGLLLTSSAPVRPSERAGYADGGREDEGGEQTSDLVARQRDQAVVSSAGSPFFASRSRSCSAARVAAR